MRMKLAAFLVAAFAAALLASPAFAAHGHGGRSGSTIIAFQD
jgi:ABC-type sugar transport system substrate-binding protein